MKKLISAGLTAALAATLGGASAVIAPPIPAFAATQAPVYVQTFGIPSSWDVNGAMKFVDQYTGRTVLIRKACPAQKDCISIKAGTVGGGTKGNVGYTSPITTHTAWGWGKPKVTWKTVTITIDLKKASAKKFNAATRKWLVAHEIGHWYALPHQKSRVSFMYPYVPMPPMKVTTAEKRHLASR